jgi:hypothetical protein
MSDDFRQNMQGSSGYEGFDPLNEEQRNKLRLADQLNGWIEEEDPDFESGIAIFQMGRQLAEDVNPNDNHRLRPMKINEQLIERERRKQIEIQKRKMAPPQLQRVAPIQSAPQRQTRQVEEKKSKKTKRIVNDDSPQMELFSTQPESSSINIDDTSNQLELSLFNKNNDIVLNRIISVEEEMVKIKSSYKNLEKNYEELVDKHGKMLEILQKMFILISKKA